MAKIWTKKQHQTRQWRVRPAWQGAGRLAREIGISPLVAQLLYNRGIDEPTVARQFLQPSLSDLADPAGFLGIDTAVQRIRHAIENDEKIVIYGDYDVDGIVGTSILWHCLRLAGKEVDFYVPHRIDEGYGLNVEAIGDLAQRGTNLIITVDCGVTAVEPARLAAEAGMDIIITDHHQIESELPQAVAVVHPNLPNQNYSNKNLCGAGVAFKLAWAIAQEFSGAKKVSDEFREFLISATALVALGTIADVVPLTGENRVLAKYGMQALAASEDKAIKALIAASGLTGAKLDSSDIGFRLAPRLNAAGRMGHARLAVELFTKSNENQAREIARYLEGQNQHRQRVEKTIAEEALEQVKALGMDDEKWSGLVLAGENWHGGVIGIVASRVVDRYHRPTIVISVQGDKAMGSCRSVPGVNMVEALQGCSEHLQGFGGHAMAAGLTLAPESIDNFRAAFNDYITNNSHADDLVPTLDIDAEVTLADLTLPAVQMINKLGPFGAGNPQARLVARNLRLVGQPRRMGKKNEHLQFNVAAPNDPDAQLRPGGILRVVAFSKAKTWEKKLIQAQSIDLAFEPLINRFNGNTTVELIAEDAHFDPNPND
ncbi:MAG: single-stranded-DNA-specific exonuclease RecJ [Sedimentisphaerales bacterium]|nr:single-stranded-DNA-specific exonuclease RecJ [Sedimentisphaerales bacterium]